MDEIEEKTGAYIQSKMRGLVYPLVTGWQYGVDGIWSDDDTLTITGKYIRCLTLK